MQKIVPELEANNGLRLWYCYPNCGFRLTATAGTDKMTTFVTVGQNRVFAHPGRVHVPELINAEGWRTFVPTVRARVHGERP
jgi:hypothetical protein